MMTDLLLLGASVYVAALGAEAVVLARYFSRNKERTSSGG